MGEQIKGQHMIEKQKKKRRETAAITNKAKQYAPRVQSAGQNKCREGGLMPQIEQFTGICMAQILAARSANAAI